MSAIRWFNLLLVGLGCLTLLAGCGRPKSELQRVLELGELRVLTRNAPTTYYRGARGETGIEYELAKGFAAHLGVKLRMVVEPNVAGVLGALKAHKGHVAAAGLTATAARQDHFWFTPPYQHITEQVIYRRGEWRPRDIDDLRGHLEVMAGSSHAEHLAELVPDHPGLTWTENEDLDSEELIALVEEELIDYTVVDSNEFALARRYYPELGVAFELTDPQPLAWAFPRSTDSSLYQAATGYFKKLKREGTLAQLEAQFYGHVTDFDYVGTRTYLSDINLKLPEYRAVFERAAEENGLDWRLLAAMAYQESHWNPRAVSPTGVRGMMMLTQNTARYLGIEKRTDPIQSIEGGARYYAKLRKKIPKRIDEPDRTWLAVAAYNIGFGHLEDARILTEVQGGDPDSWNAVKERLPLLRKRQYYKQTKYGYARGHEAVQYVENIRSYYDILVWITDQPTEPALTAPREPLENAPAVL